VYLFFYYPKEKAKEKQNKSPEENKRKTKRKNPPLKKQIVFPFLSA
jgi:hypothetical protein